MCGIVGIVGKREVAPLLVDALKRLEYRGYDSAGVATVHDGHLDRRRAEGKLANLDRKLGEEPLAGRSASATPGGPPMGRRRKATPIRISVMASPSFTTASSRTSLPCAPS
jgi:glucosamine--fructose-6-phosphate aminotransferase (isomerizing)